jgi:hypothetical protein
MIMCFLMPLQAMREAAGALSRARPGVPLYDRRRKAEWALRLQAAWLRCAPDCSSWAHALKVW